ncbi:MAG: dihydropteroate synthase [Hyphomicrobiaceae bacterium]|nr:dihydropteroate synthase [Hyphomicrobiaceae bacterium]
MTLPQADESAPAGGMLIVAERINASRRAIRGALEAMDAGAIQREATAQAAAGAHYIDVNAGTFPGREAELLCWLVDVVQAATPLPLCLDCPDPAALAAALPRVKAPRPIINSINLEDDRFDRVLPLVRDFGAKVVALAQGQGVPPTTADGKADLAARLVERLVAAGVPLDDIYVDPLVFPVGVDPRSALATIDAIGEIMHRFPGVHTICGLTNVSHGLPARALVNRTFLVAAMGRGMDAAIIDPTDAHLMAAMRAAQAVLGRDEYCMAFIEEFMAGRVAA